MDLWTICVPVKGEFCLVLLWVSSGVVAPSVSLRLCLIHLVRSLRCLVSLSLVASLPLKRTVLGGCFCGSLSCSVVKCGLHINECICLAACLRPGSNPAALACRIRSLAYPLCLSRSSTLSSSSAFPASQAAAAGSTAGLDGLHLSRESHVNSLFAAPRNFPP